MNHLKLKEHHLVGLVLFLAFSIRLIFSLFYHHPLHYIFSDAANYVNIADQIRVGQWSVDTFFQPIGFPLVILALKSFFGAHWASALAIAHSLLSTLSLGLTFLVARRHFGKKIGLGLLLIGGLHPPLIIFCGFAMTETFFTFCLSGMLWSLDQIQKNHFKNPRVQILFGAFFSLSLLFKGTTLFVLPLLALYLIYQKKYKALGWIMLPVFVFQMGHGILTSQTIARFQTGSSNGGLNLIEGKCPHKWNVDSLGHEWLSPAYAQLGHHTESSKKIWPEPFTNSSFFVRAALDCVMQNPRILIQSFEAWPMLFIGNFAWPINQSPSAHWIRLHEMFFVLWALSGLFIFIVLNRQRSSHFIPWLLAILGLLVCVYIGKSEARYRIPFDLIFITLSLQGWLQLFRLEKQIPQP